MADEVNTQPRLVEIAIEPKSKADEGKLFAALARLAEEDPTFGVSIDPESKQTILKGTSERHLDDKIDDLRRTYNIRANVGAPQVAFLERITQPAEAAYTYKKQTGGSGQFASVKLRIAPNEPGKGNQFESRIVPGAVPDQYIPGIEKGLASVLASGVVAGFPVVDVKVELIDGKYHDVDSSALAFEIAARAAMREALSAARSVLLEPIMKVEVTTPEIFVGAVVEDLGRRRGNILGRNADGGATVVSAMVPLMTMFGYVNSLRAMGGGRATLTMHFDHYAPAPLSGGEPPFRPAVGMRA